MKVAKLNIHFDYKRENRKVFLWCLGTFIISWILVLVTYFSHKTVRGQESTWKIIAYICSQLSNHFGNATVLTTYSVIMHSLCERFDILNSLLRFKQSIDFISMIIFLFIAKKKICFYFLV